MCVCRFLICRLRGFDLNARRPRVNFWEKQFGEVAGACRHCIFDVGFGL